MQTIKIYGCPSCGSEHSKREMKKARLDNTEGFTCRFCTNKETLEYLGIYECKY